MADNLARSTLLDWLRTRQEPLSLTQIQAGAPAQVPERTLRRWLAGWVAQGVLQRSGARRSTRYRYRPPAAHPAFLDAVPAPHRDSLLKQLRDLWTHTSTALEGNTLTLGDTHFILEEGLTISGKPLKEHREIVGHASAISLIYQSLNAALTEQLVFALHKAVQTEIVTDIYKPNGAWKNEMNGTYAVTSDNRQVFIEYAQPAEVPVLMAALLDDMNRCGILPRDQAAVYYAKVHAALVHIHPFWDGNGRIARLLANVPVLKSGLPPLIIPVDQRRRYIQLLADYEIAVGQLNRATGLWPDEDALQPFADFCAQQYAVTLELLAQACRVGA